ncbi:hypothetical protein ACFE04_026583 [Oxalis oulophora]
MRVSLTPIKQCIVPSTYNFMQNDSLHPISVSNSRRELITLAVATTTSKKYKRLTTKNWEKLLLDPINNDNIDERQPVKLGKRWKEYQGVRNWEGLLDPLDDNLRNEILRYGDFVDASYKAFDFNPTSPTYGTCRYPKNTLFERSGLPETGYRLTKHLRATSSIRLPRWIEKGPNWANTQSSWIGYVAVCQDKEEIKRLGRRDIVISFRGTATCHEWLENLRATLTPLSHGPTGPMVESGFLSLYTSGAKSLQVMVREEISRLLQRYVDEPLSLTITGHSLGAALATLTAYDIKTTFKRSPLVTVISFGGPRVGNRSFREKLEKQGTNVLRIVNSDDLITKVPGFVLDYNESDVAINESDVAQLAGLPSWILKRVEDTQLVYSEVGRELRLSSKDSPYLNSINVATCHELRTYLHLIHDISIAYYRP